MNTVMLDALVIRGSVNIYDRDLCCVGGLLRGLLPAHCATLGPATYFVCAFSPNCKKITFKFFFQDTSNEKAIYFFATHQIIVNHNKKGLYAIFGTQLIKKLHVSFFNTTNNIINTCNFFRTKHIKNITYKFLRTRKINIL